MKFSSLVKGTRARKTIQFPVPGATRNEAGEWTGAVVDVDLRPLTPSELAECFEAAASYAKARGVEARDGEPIFDLAFRAQVVLRSALDAEKKDEAVPFFDSVDQILGGDFSDGHLLYLFELADSWQAECSPQIPKLDPSVFQRVTVSAAKGESGDFLALAPAIRWLCFRTLAALYATSLLRKSDSGESSLAPSNAS